MAGIIRRAVFLSLILVMLYGAEIYGQHGSTIISHLTTENGLPQNSVNDLHIGKYGFLWIITEKGLVRYDGSEFIKIIPKEENFAYNNYNKIRLGEDSARNLLAFHPFEGIYSLKSDWIQCPDISHSVKSDLEIDCIGGMINYQKKIFANYPEYLARLKFIAGKIFTQDSTIYIWKDKDDTLKIFDRNGFKKIIFGSKIINDKVGLLGSDLLVITDDKVLNIIRKDRIIFRTKLEHIFPADIYSNAANYAILNYQKECYIYAVNTLYKISFDADKKIETEKILTDLQIKDPSKLEIDNKNNIYFIGTKFDGIYVIRNNPFKKVVFRGVNEKSIYAQVKIDESNYLSNGCYLNREKGVTRKFKRMAEPYTYLSEGKKLWVSKFNSFSCLDLNTNAILWQKAISPYSTCMRVSPFDHKKYVSIGADIYRIEDNNLRKLNINRSGQIKKIISFLFYEENKLMVATETGLYTYDFKTNNLDPLKTTGVFRSLEPDINQKDIWIGTYGNGFCLFRDNTLYKMPLDKNKILANVHTFVEDKMKRIWMTTNNGLVVVDKDQLMKCVSDTTYQPDYRIFSTKDGLTSSEFNGGCYPAHLVFEDGTVSLPTINGIVQFNPNNIPKWDLVNHVYIKKISIDGRMIPDFKNITVDHDFEQISVSVITPFMNLYKNIDIKYAINNNGKVMWQDIPADGRITINTLKSGKYKLLLKTSENQSDITSIDIIVQKAFYESAWFIILCLLIFLSSLLVFSKLNNRRLKKENEVLENRVKERTLAQQETIKELDYIIHKLLETEKSLTENVAVKEQLVSLVLHDMSSPINYLRLAAEKLNKNIHHYDKERLERELFNMNEAIQEIHSFSKSFFEWVNFQRNGIALNPHSIPLMVIFSELADLFKNIIARNGNRLVMRETDIVVVSDKNILVTILRNIIDNANKYTNKGTLSLSAHVSGDGTCVIQLADEGQGIPDDIIAKIRKALISPDNIGELPGFGYKLIVELLPMINAHLTIVNNHPEKGVTISIYLKNLEEKTPHGQFEEI